jgi:hypothetical protein
MQVLSPRRDDSFAGPSEAHRIASGAGEVRVQLINLPFRIFGA